LFSPEVFQKKQSQRLSPFERIYQFPLTRMQDSRPGKLAQGICCLDSAAEVECTQILQLSLGRLGEDNRGCSKKKGHY